MNKYADLLIISRKIDYDGEYIMNEKARNIICWMAIVAFVVVMMALLYFSTQQVGESSEIIVIYAPVPDFII